MTTIDTDVLVCGGGCAGLGAALAAARGGASVLLSERAPFAGGIVTAVGLPFMDGIADWETGRLVVRGLPLEWLVRLGLGPADAQTLDPFVPDRLAWLRKHGSVAVPDIERFKILADDMLREAGVRTLFHSMAVAVERHGDAIRGVALANKNGLMRVRPKIVVDATGDADIAHWAGCPMDVRAETMPMTLHFRVGNVRHHGEIRRLAEEAMLRAVGRGELQYAYGPGLTSIFAEDEAYVHATRVVGDAADAWDLSRAEAQARREAYALWRAWKREVPGFEGSYYIGSGPFIGVRETRRIAGAYVLSRDDVAAGRRFDDAIATGSWYMDIHPHETTGGSAHSQAQNATRVAPAPYDIPYRSLLPRDVDNLLVAGRCHSADRDAASSTRVTVTAMAMGEAAGHAAALAVADGTSTAELDGVRVREGLARHGGGPFTD